MHLFQQMKKKSQKTALFFSSLAISLFVLSAPLHTSTLGLLELNSTDITAAGSDFAADILFDGFYRMNIDDAISGRDFVVNARLASSSLPGGHLEIRAKPDPALTGGSNPVQNTTWVDLPGTDVVLYELDAITLTNYDLDVEVRLVGASVANFAENSSGYNADIIFTYVETWT